MLMLAVEAAVDPVGRPLPEHLGGVLHGFVERALLNHASHLIPVLRPEGDDEYASLAIEPPPFGQHIATQLRFGCILFRDATQSWSVIARALLEQAKENDINNRAIQVVRAWIYQPGSQPQAVVVDGRLIDETPLPESPGAWVRRSAIRVPEVAAAIRAYSLEFRSPLLLGSRGYIRREHKVPWPTLKSLLDSIAKRMVVLEPDLAQMMGIVQGWRAGDRFDQIEALTPADKPATQVQWPYSVHRGIFKPGIVGELIFVAQLGPAELALLEWGQWLGVGQQTTMGCGRYVLRPAAPSAV